jgi:hypothetical protein
MAGAKAMAKVDTRSVTGRRSLSFASMDEILADVESLDRAGGLRGLGNWTPAQIVDHVTRGITMSIDGTTLRAPLLLRLFARLIKGRALRNGLPPGFKVPFDFFRPGDTVTWQEARRSLGREVERIRRGARMVQPSPLLGPMTHDEWVKLHCRHAELHFSFIVAAPEKA